MRKVFWLLLAWLCVLPWNAGAQADQGTAACTVGGNRILALDDATSTLGYYVTVNLGPSSGTSGNILLDFNATAFTGGTDYRLDLRIPEDGALGASAFVNGFATNPTAAGRNWIVFNVNGSADTHVGGQIDVVLDIGFMPKTFQIYVRPVGGGTSDFDFTLDCYLAF